jgi:hypothetical protein
MVPMIRRHVSKGHCVSSDCSSPTSVAADDPDIPNSPTLLPCKTLENILEESGEGEPSVYFHDDPDESYDLEVRTDLESSVFGSLAESNLLADTDVAQPAGDYCRNNVLQQTQLERVLSKAASHMKREKERQLSNSTSSTSTKTDESESSNAFTDFDSETMFNSILDLSTINSRSIKGVESDNSQTKSASLSCSIKEPNSVVLSEQNYTHLQENETCAFESQYASPPLISIQIQQELTALQRKIQVAQTHFQQATQGLQDDLHRAHTLVETLQVQLERAHQQQEEALQRLQGANLKREHQLEADAIRMLHLQILQQCLSTKVTRDMIAAPMDSYSNNYGLGGDGSTVDNGGYRDGTSILEKMASLTMADVSCRFSVQLYQDVSTEELRLIRTRLQAILELFYTAQRRKESTNLRWQTQAEIMKQDATSKYILYCRYRQI